MSSQNKDRDTAKDDSEHSTVVDTRFRTPDVWKWNARLRGPLPGWSQKHTAALCFKGVPQFITNIFSFCWLYFMMQFVERLFL